MTKSWKIALLIGAGAIITAVIASLVWGASWRMALANRDFREGKTDKAATVYREMAVDQPRSPHILHNVGLAEYQKGQFPKGLETLQKAVGNATGLKTTASADLNKIFYHTGNAAFKNAAINVGSMQTAPIVAAPTMAAPNASDPANGYQEALQDYKKAIEADPRDLDAKYNYELALLRLKDSQKQQQRQEKDLKDANQGKSGNKDSKGSNSGNPDKQQNQNGNSGQNDKTQNNPNQQKTGTNQQPQKGQMTQQEAEALLKMAEHGDQYQAPVIQSNAGTAEKDW